MNEEENHSNILLRCLFHDLAHLNSFRQKFILREIYLHIYPIIVENKNELSIANIRLPPAEDKSYLASNSKSIGCWEG